MDPSTLCSTRLVRSELVPVERREAGTGRIELLSWGCRDFADSSSSFPPYLITQWHDTVLSEVAAGHCFSWLKFCLSFLVMGLKVHVRSKLFYPVEQAFMRSHWR